MGKLVRDRIPEIIEASGGSAHVRILNRAEYDAALLDKLDEEVAELRNAEPEYRLEEAADVYAVLLACVGGLGADAHGLATAANREALGGFAARIWWEGWGRRCSPAAARGPALGCLVAPGQPIGLGRVGQSWWSTPVDVLAGRRVTESKRTDHFGD